MEGPPGGGTMIAWVAGTSFMSVAKPIGRPYPIKGADEMYGELLLQLGRPAEAVPWFEKALVRTPNRSRAVLGLARAAGKAGDAAKSRKAYAQFAANWRTAEGSPPELAEAKAALVERRTKNEERQRGNEERRTRRGNGER